MRVVKRVLVVLGLGVLVAAALRVRGRGGAPPIDSGWRELDITNAP